MKGLKDLIQRRINGNICKLEIAALLGAVKLAR